MPQSQTSPKTSCRVYCAGPLFNQAERTEMTAIADCLTRAGYFVYLPHRDGMEFRLVLDVLVERGWSTATAGEFLHAAIFALDVYQLAVECDAMVWNLNGRTPDEGAVAEAAMAWTLGKPLVAYKDDVRSLISGRLNPLLAGMVDFETVEDFELLPQCLAALGDKPQRTEGLLERLSEKMQRVRDAATR
jgi:nucleoside 2-deoxyribosyltransferase